MESPIHSLQQSTIVSLAGNSKLDQVQAALAQLRDAFLDELAERCTGLEHQVLALRDTENFSDAYDALYRSIHSLKGSAGTHGIPLISAACHELEDALNTIDSEHLTPLEKFISYALSGIDIIQKIGEQPQDSDSSSLQEQLEQNRSRFYAQQRAVMIAVDSQLIQLLCREALKDLPLQFTTSDNGLTAIDRLMNMRYDLLIVSGELKFLNGMSITYALRASDSVNKNIKIIYLTSTSKTDFAKDLAPDSIVHKDKAFASTLEHVVSQLML